MKSNRKLKNFLISLATIAVTSCAPAIKPLERVEDQASFLQQVTENNPQIKTLKAKARVEVMTKGKSYNFKIGLMMTSAAQMFIETYGLGVPQGYASLLNDKLTVVFPSSKEMYVGTGSSSLTRMLQINVTMNELFDPILKKLIVSQDSPPSIDAQGNHWIIKDHDKTLFYVNDSKWVDKIERRMGFLVEYGDPVSAKTKFPKSIRLSYEHQSIKLTFDDVVVNQPMVYESFQMNVPTEGFKVVPIE